MYLSLHEYAAEKLSAGGSAARREAEQRHERYFAGFGTDEAIESLYRHGGIRRRRALALELDNLVVACRRAAGRGNGDTAVAAYRAVWEALDLQGPYALGAALGDQVLALDGITPSLLTAARWTRALAAWRAGRMDEAAAWLAQALALARETNERGREGSVLFILGNLHAEQGHMDEAQRCYEAALSIQREVGQRRIESVILGNLGNVHGEQSRADAAQACFDAALAIHREIGNRSGEATVLGNLGNLLCDQGRMDEARASYSQALAIAREVGSRSSEGGVLGNLGTLDYEQGRLDDARAHFEAALAIHREVGNRPVEGLARATSARWLPIGARFEPPMPPAELHSQCIEDTVGYNGSSGCACRVVRARRWQLLGAPAKGCFQARNSGCCQAATGRRRCCANLISTLKTCRSNWHAIQPMADAGAERR